MSVDRRHAVDAASLGSRRAVKKHPLRQALRPDDGTVPLAGKSGALRAAIFGINDGLLANLSLVLGMAGAGAARNVVVLAGVAGLLAGAFSMGAGEYVSMRAQRELFEWVLAREATDLADDPEGEAQEFVDVLSLRGIPRDLAETIATAVKADPALALDVHAKIELGLDPDGLGSPYAAAGSSFVSFVAGALLPLIPFLVASRGVAVWVSAPVSLGALFVIGASMSVLSKRSWAFSGARMVAIGASAAFVTYGVGHLIGLATSL